MELSAVILAGGESKRMGRAKAWLEYEGKSLLQLGVEKARALGSKEVFVSGRAGEDYAALKCPVLFDLEPGFGPLGGIERGLQQCHTPLLLVLAVDLPQMSVSFLQNLLARCDRLTGIVPKLHQQLEPLAAIYPKRCLTLAAAAIARSRWAVRDFAEAARQERAVRTFSVAPADEKYFANWNYPADLPSSVDSIRSCPN